jgi:beta-fructofuranosidase
MIIVGAIHQQFRQGMWEMQDFFSVDYKTGAPSSKWVLKVGLIDELHDYYTISTYDKIAQRLIPEFPELDIGSGYRHDYGKFYAAKSLFDHLKKRRILVGWVNESDSLEVDDAKGWASMIVSYQALKQWPFCSAFCGVFISYTTILIRISIISKSPACCRNGEI